MATLSAMFKLFDGYSSTIDKINKKTTDATDKILKASGSTDQFNKKLESTGASANTASGGLGKFLTVAALVAGALKGMSIVDEFTNTSARLNLINDGLQTQLELQNKIFAAADRSRGSYSEMASAISKMGLMAGKSFGSNDELIAFTELMQKSFKVGGAETSEQQGAMRQLTQAMASGRLQGDEFVSISENAPLIAQAIEKYMKDVIGAKGSLKELSSQGLITSDIIKNALFMAGDEINTQFETLPMTFADIWNKIKNGALKAFRPIIEATSNFINSDAFTDIINGVIIGINILTNVIDGLINSITENWVLIEPILIAIGLYLSYIGSVGLVGLIQKLYAVVATEWATIAPILTIIAVMATVIYMLQYLGVSFEDIFGYIGGIVGVTVAGIWDLFLGLFEFILGVVNYLVNPFINFANFLGNVFTSPISSIIYLFQSMADNVLGILEKIASAMDFVFGSNMADTVTGWRTGLKDMADAAVAKYAPNENYQKTIQNIDYSVSDFGLKRMEYGKSWDAGQAVGKNVYSKLEGAIGGLTNSLIGTESDFDLSKFGTTSKPVNVKGKVKISDEDIQYLKDMAERDYINKFSTATLAPTIEVQFGDVHETADVNKMYGVISKLLKEEISVVAEG